MLLTRTELLLMFVVFFPYCVRSRNGARYTHSYYGSLYRSRGQL